MRFNWEEISKVTGGTLLSGRPDTVVFSYAQDSRQVQAGDLFFPILGPNRDGHDFLAEVARRGCRHFLISRREALDLLERKVPREELHVICVEDTQQALEDLARYALSKMGCTIVGVTGSTGKTSTRDMTACVLRSAYRVGATPGNLNTPIGMSLAILGMAEDTEVAVLEMGMDHAGEIATLVRIAPPHVALITNIGISHLEHLGSREGIYRAKMEITEQMGKDDVLLVSQGQDFLRRARIEEDYGQRGFLLSVTGEEADCDLRIHSLEEEGADGVRFAISRQEQGEETVTSFTLPVPGRHNALNAALAVGAGLALGVTMEQAAKALGALELTGGRLKTLHIGAYTLLDDTYNASPDSARAAIDVLMAIPTGRHFAVLLDMLELGEGTEKEHEQVGRYAAEKGVDRIYTYGELSAHLARGAGIRGRHFDNKDAIGATLLKEVRPGDAILFKGSRGAHAETVLGTVRETLMKRAQQEGTV